MAIWRMPESTKLETQTLEKLATAPWRLLRNVTPLSNAPVALLRPLLDDLVQEESYLEIRDSTNRPGELVLAIRLDSRRAAVWETNVPAVMQSLHTGPAQPGATLQVSNVSATISTTLARVSDWTLLAISHDSESPMTAGGLLADLRARIERDGAPFTARATNYWLEVECDLARLNRAFDLGWKLPGETPAVSMATFGEDGKVRTVGRLDFPGPVPVELEPWNIPTNLVHDPLVGFMAIRGFRSLLKSVAGWNEARLGVPPNQAFFWSQNGPPLHFFALPSASASNRFQAIADFLLQKVNPIMVAVPKLKGLKYGSFELSGDSLIRWRGIPMLAPNVGLVGDQGSEFVTGGLFPNRLVKQPAPSALLQQLHTETNLVFYDWEITQPNAYGLIQMTQLARFVFGRARLSMTNNASLPWLTAVSTNLGPAGTALRVSGSNQLGFSRTSTIGLTGFELHLLSDWLESPNFPRGSFTLDTQPPGAPPLEIQSGKSRP